MTSISKYGQINAKVRAMRSNLLEKSLLQKLINSTDFQEIISHLSATRYRDFITRKDIDAVTLEYSITLENINQWKHLKKNCSKELTAVIDYFIEEYELRKLKHLLRLWHQHKKINTPLLKQKIRYDLSVERIVDSQNIHKLIENLQDIPYQSILVQCLSQYDEVNSVFPFEIALDQDYYKRLWHLTDSFGKKDKHHSRKILGIEIDLLNLEWLTRFKDYYDVTPTSLSDYLISKESDDNGSFLKNIDQAESALDILKEIVGKQKVEKLQNFNFNEKIALFEKALYKIMLSEAKKAFTGYPFTISFLWGYRALLKFEEKNLFSIIQAKIYQVSQEHISQYLVL